MKIDEIALRVAEKLEPRGRTYSPEHYIEFAHALLAELSKDVEPVGICDTKNRIKWAGNDDSHRYSSAPNFIEAGTEIFTRPISANTAEIEQRVAEACAKCVDPSREHKETQNDYIGGEDGIELLSGMAEAIRSGKLREYL